MAKKRKASLLDSCSEDEISVEHFRRPNPPSSRIRAPAKPVIPKAPQKRARKLNCVLIPPSRRPSALNPIYNQQPVHHRSSASADAKSGAAMVKRPIRNLPKPIYDESKAVDHDDVEEKNDETANDSDETTDFRDGLSPPASPGSARGEGRSGSEYELDSEGEDEEAEEGEEMQNLDVDILDAGPSSEEYTGSDTKMSDDEPASRKLKKSGRAAKPTAAKAKPGTNKSGRGGKKAESMVDITSRAGGPPGLDLDLPPLSDINEIFMDLTKKAIGQGLDGFLKQMGSTKLRVATMCSGTESPLIALEEVRDSLRKLGAGELHIDHLFSAEIVPYKQAYIERNFHPPIIFRDIAEMTYASKHNLTEATTAWGGKAKIPKALHMLIAGTSCVDFSALNNHRRVLTRDQGGESSVTWFAVYDYCKQYRPAIVLLENVFNGPWDEMTKYYQDIGYEVAGVKADTKNHGLPQTRQRGYLVCFDSKKAGANDSKKGNDWVDLMRAFRRNASSPVTEFLLPNDVVRAKQRGVLVTEDATKGYTWDRCRIIHIQYRSLKQLGNRHPFTKWSEGGIISVPERGIRSWYRKQPDRVRDALEIFTLRKAPECDARYKTRIWDVSQNVHMSPDNARFGISGCLTPTGSFFLSDAGRALAPEEIMMLQGLPWNRISFTTETTAEIQDLAGNAMSTTVVGSAILAALIAGRDVIRPVGEAVAQSVTSSTSEQAQGLQETSKPVHTKHSSSEVDMQAMLEGSEASVQRCVCEGVSGSAQDPLQKCTECGHWSCVTCGGNPSHHYQREPQSGQIRQDPAHFEQKLRSMLPLQLLFHVDPEAVSRAIGDADLLVRSMEDTFSFSHVKRDRQWTVVYCAPRARLHLVIRDGKVEWRLFALPHASLPSNDKLRGNLEQPLALAAVVNNLYDVDWHIRTISQQDWTIEVQGLGGEDTEEDKVPSWRSNIGLRVFSDEKVWPKLEISVPTQFDSKLRSSVSGTYKALPNCGTAEDSLYRRIGPSTDGGQVYLFKDPTRIGEPHLDRFVFSKEHEQLDYRQSRPVIASLAPSWKPYEEHTVFEEPVLSGSSWQTFKHHQVRLEQVVPNLELQRPQSPAQKADSCTKAEFVAGCILQASIPDDCNLYKDQAHVLEAMRRQLPSDQWTPLTITGGCSTTKCAPARPHVLWMWKNDTGKIKPYEDPVSAGVYEKSMRSRPDPIHLKARRLGPGTSTVEFGINLASLAHRAEARLPKNDGLVKMKWRVQQNSYSGTPHKSFKLHPTRTAPYIRNLGWKYDLFAKQKVVLGWMMEQEAGAGKRFMIEESQEAFVPSLNWRAEVRAEAPIHVRGGICADHPGFGKTITSLALIHSGLQTDEDSIMRDLQARQNNNPSAEGLWPIKATLVVAPYSLVRQWRSEIHKHLGYEEKKKQVLVIATYNDLLKYKKKDFEGAGIIVVGRNVLGSDEYAEHLAAFAATPGPAKQSVREYTRWLQFVCGQLPELLRTLDGHGIAAARRQVLDKTDARAESNDFKTNVPSRRLVGKELFAKAAAGQQVEKKKKYDTSTATSILNTCFENPVFEMFYFNRIIVDEFQLPKDPKELKEMAGVNELKADKRWGLSATPELRDSYHIATIAKLLGVTLPVCSPSTRSLSKSSIRALKADMTDFELFDSMRETRSDSMNARIHELDQEFLNAFCRQNVMDHKIPFEEHLVPVNLDIAHQATYAELSHKLMSTEMIIRKADKSQITARDNRYREAIRNCSTAEEALSKAAASHALLTCKDNPLLGLINSSKTEIQESVKGFKQALRQAPADAALDDTLSTLLDHENLGDQETLQMIERFVLEIRGPLSAPPQPRKNVNKQTGDQEDVEDVAVPKTSDKNAKFVEAVNNLSQVMVTSVRSLRYFRSIQRLQQTLSEAQHCDSPTCKTDCNTAATSALCGHQICKHCYDMAKAQDAIICPNDGCYASLNDFDLVWSDSLSAAPPLSEHGAKIDKAVDIAAGVKADGEKANLFVQYQSQLQQVKVALADRNIPAIVVEKEKEASDQIAEFISDDNTDTVLVLNASNETAAGLNLQCANHVIFLSPLLREHQYHYEATMAQAIGRARRPGQKKTVHVHRIAALHTIDVDILEQRERRTTALKERYAPTINPPPAVAQLEQLSSPEPQRTQLIEETGYFSLRPHSWLYRCGADRLAEELANAQKGDRIIGWQDFSSNIMFSSGFNEDD